MKTINLIFLVSGNGGTLKFFFHSIEMLNLPFKIIAVIADRKCGAIDFTNNMKIPTYIFENWNDEIDKINSLLLLYNANIIITNIHKILKTETVELFNEKLINLHYSLLPAYGGVIGMKTIELAKHDKAKIIGATCHFVNEKLDAGTIICQGCICVDWNDNDVITRNKIFQIACFVLLNSIISIQHVMLPDFDYSYNSKMEFIFSPKLKFDASHFSDSFWKRIEKI